MKCFTWLIFLCFSVCTIPVLSQQSIFVINNTGFQLNVKVSQIGPDTLEPAAWWERARSFPQYISPYQISFEYEDRFFNQIVMRLH